MVMVSLSYGYGGLYTLFPVLFFSSHWFLFSLSIVFPADMVGMQDETVRAIGPVTGPLYKEYLVCQYDHMINSKGLWFGHNPFNFSLPVLLAQLSVISLATTITYHFLRPLGQSTTTAQVLAGVIIGPSILGRYPTYVINLFPPDGRLILHTVAEVGFMFHLFLIGVQMDTNLLKKAGRNVVLIGSAGFALPFALGGLGYFTMSRLMTLNKTLTNCLPFIIALNSMTSFAVITSLLADLNILNSELGRLASSISMISDMCSWAVSTIMTSMGLSIVASNWVSLWSIVWITIFLLTIFFILRPLVIWIAKRTPEGESMKDTHFLAIVLIVVGCGFCSEVVGQHIAFGPFMLGIAVPDGPPLATTLVYKIDTISTGLFLPVFFAISGLQANLFSIGETRSALIIEFIIILGYLGKFAGTIMAAIYCSVPFWDALTLAIIMCCKGIIEVATYIMWKDSKIVNDQAFSLLLITMLIVTGVARPIVRYLYDPSKKYMGYRRRTILHSKDNVDLRVLVCIHNEDNVPTMINLLEASNPTRFSAISVFVLHLMELKGRASSILVPLNDKNVLTFHLHNLEHAANAFNNYEQHNQGRVMVQHFASVAPYTSMHDDICTVAVDKRTTIVIIPYHKRWTIDGTVGTTSPFIRTVNQNVINKAPCSVGVLVDRGQIGGNQSVLSGQSLYRMALLFLGGTDDREALAYAKRMAEHQNVTLTLICLKQWGEFKYSNDKKGKSSLDVELISQFKANAIGNDRMFCKEEMVKDGVGTTEVIRSIEDDFDLFIVGKHHDPGSPLLCGLDEWSECPELGVLGDLLANSDFQFSVLVVRQQPFRAKRMSNKRNLPVTNDQARDSKVHHDSDDEEGQLPIDIRSGL